MQRVDCDPCLMNKRKHESIQTLQNNKLNENRNSLTLVHIHTEQGHQDTKDNHPQNPTQNRLHKYGS
jgi:hypothetical protein